MTRISSKDWYWCNQALLLASRKSWSWFCPRAQRKNNRSWNQKRSVTTRIRYGCFF